MNRRAFLVLPAGLVAAWAVPTAARSGVADDWAPFNSLASVFLSLIQATDPIADFIEKKRFVRFLNHMNETLGEIITTKRHIRTDLSTAACSDGAPTTAIESARDLSRLLEVLEAQIETLAICIRPADVRRETETIVERMSGIRAGKAWISSVDQYCAMSSGGRDELLNDINASADIVQDAQSQLGDLLAKLGQ
jgi:hypothetical protein